MWKTCFIFSNHALTILYRIFLNWPLILGAGAILSQSLSVILFSSKLNVVSDSKHFLPPTAQPRDGCCKIASYFSSDSIPWIGKEPGVIRNQTSFLKKVWINGKTFYVLGSEDVIFLRRQYSQIDLYIKCNLCQIPNWLLFKKLLNLF